MESSELQLRALELATKAHRQQTRWDKKTPYITHPVKVAEMVEGDLEKVVAYLHDVVEDTSYSLDDLRREGFPKLIVDAVDAITKRDGESYGEYIPRVCENRLAMVVKIADITHNLENLKKGSMKDKYEIARLYIGLRLKSPFSIMDITVSW